MENSYSIQRVPRYKNVTLCVYFTSFFIYLISSTCILTLAPKSYQFFWIFCIIQTILNLLVAIGLPLSFIYNKIKCFTKYMLYIIHFIQSIVIFVLPSNSNKLLTYYNTPLFTLFICNFIINTLFSFYYYLNLSVPTVRYIAVPNV